MNFSYPFIRRPVGTTLLGVGLFLVGAVAYAFLPVASRVPDYARLIGALVIDDRMPADRKVILGAAACYLVLGRDLISDSIPVIGGLDDLVVVVLAVDVFLDGVPPELLQEKLHDLAIERSAFDRDVAQIRRWKRNRFDHGPNSAGAESACQNYDLRKIRAIRGGCLTARCGIGAS